MNASPAPQASLLLPDQSIVPVSGDIILGREPEIAPQVVSGSAKALVLSDPDRRLSRVHALLSLTAAGATLTDLGSANGTSVMQPDESQWSKLTAQQPVTLQAGARIKVAGQELHYLPAAPAVVEASAADPTPVVAPAPAVQPTPEPEPETTPERLTRPESIRPSPTEPAAGGGLQGVADYTFVRRLGSGERGAYYLAAPPERLQLDVEYVVVKVVSGPTSDDAFRRPTRELRAFAAAGSEYLIKVYDAGQHQGLLFYSMDYVPGGSLDAPNAPVSKEAAIKAVAQAGRAANALHEVGVVHQGIAPKRILLGENHAYLADLGLAQLITPESFATSIGDFDGLEFLDPSLLTGARGTPATDIWSLAATLNWALSGVGVFGPIPKDPLLAVRTVLTRKPVPSEGIAPELSAVISACVDADQSARPATALDFAKSLEAVL